MQPNPRYRLATDTPLNAGAPIVLSGNSAHYLAQVVRVKVGDVIGLFTKRDGEWLAIVEEIRRREVVVRVDVQSRKPALPLGLTVCFAPIKGGRMETIIEKATELGASVLQPVLTQRTIVDKVNLDRAEAIAREAAEQCERVDWPEIREPVKLVRLLGDWPLDLPLIYGDESGKSGSITAMLEERKAPRSWAILSGPEGGFTAEEFAALSQVKAAVGVGLGPRILRADTAMITLGALTLAAWGDWHERPRFSPGPRVLNQQ